MPFSRIKVTSFRNLADGEIDTGADRVFWWGKTAKARPTFSRPSITYLMGVLLGPRWTRRPRVRGMAEFAIDGKARMREGDATALMDSIRVRWKDKIKDIRRNDKPVRDRKELVEINPAVIFCHEDYSFAAGEPERRRFFFDPIG